MKKEYIDITHVRQLCREAVERICAQEGLDSVDVEVQVSAPTAKTKAVKIEVVERPAKIVKGSRNWQDN
jgi:hypothetical protein